jgi:hypothetical protein
MQTVYQPSISQRSKQTPDIPAATPSDHVVSIHGFAQVEQVRLRNSRESAQEFQG